MMYRFWGVDDTVVTEHKYDAVVVLSGIVPSQCYLDNNRVYVENMFLCSNDFKRAYAGLNFVKNGQADRFIIGDDKSSGLHESKVVKAFLLSNQVKPNQIVITGEVKNTRDEALKVSQLLASNSNISDFILVTSAKHMRRSAAIFNSLGLTPALYSTDRAIDHKITAKDFRPRSTGGVYRMLYEFAAYIKFILKR